MKNILIQILIILIILVDSIFSFGQKIAKEEVFAAMRKASDYMANEVSNRGGYLQYYSEDFKELFGEIPARKTQVWVEAATPQFGELYLDLYNLTGDKTYLEYARSVANVLIYGQHELGGWHYFIDFDQSGLMEWYKDTASQFIRGYEEFRHYYGNCTFDDNVTQAPTSFLLHLYNETLEPTYLGPLEKALNFILRAQYPNGGWPQRFPLKHEYVHDGFDDYTSNYTLNDDAMNNTIDLLMEAYEILGNKRYLDAARRGCDFFILSQGPEELPAWSEQYDMDIKPDWARTHEPPAYCTRQTVHTLEMLMKMFLFTGDRRYLKPIPAALNWIEVSKLDVLDGGIYEMARYYDPATNLPIDFEVLNEKSPDGYLIFNYFTNDEIPFPGHKHNVNFAKLKSDYDTVCSIERGKEKDLFNQIYKNNKIPVIPDQKTVVEIMNGRNENGIWIENILVHDNKITMLTEDNKKRIRGISTKTFRNNMRILMKYIQYSQEY